jgi:hypothetical protein
MQLYTTEPESHYERQLRIANTEYARVVKQRDGLLAATKALVEEPHGCPRCNSGQLINPAKDHWDDCPFVLAANAISAVPNA